MRPPEELLEFFRREKKFFLAAHINPDGDAIGSSLALALALESIGKEAEVYDKDPVPDFYMFLPTSEKVMASLPDSKTKIPNLILLDCGELDRAGIKEINCGTSVVIDHHETEKGFGDIKWIKPEAAATGIMVFYLIKELGVKITPDIATNLYTAIAIDTGTFRYSNTAPEVLRIAAELIESGADPSLIAENIYETWTENRLRLLLKVLNTIEIQNDVAITIVTLDMFRETGAVVSDTENFPGFTRMLKNVNVAALFREVEKDYFKVSLRSKGRKLNVAKIAEKFGGGGHRNAAGYRVRADFNIAKDVLLKAIKEA